MKIKLKSPEEFQRMLIIKGYTQRGLARAIKISSPYATQVVNGTRNPGPEIARKIVDLLGVGFEEIFFIDDADKSDQEKSEATA